MKFNATILLLTCVHAITFSQTKDKKVLFKLAETINAFTPFIEHSIYKGAGSTGGFTPSIELCDTKDGFTIRTDLHIRKYDDNFNLVWETDILKKYTLQAGANSITLGDEKNSFFIESTRSNDASVNKVDEKGKFNNIEIARYKGYPFILNHEIFFLGPNVDKKAKKLNYQLIHIEPSSNKPKTENIEAPSDEYEYSIENSNLLEKNCAWIFLAGKGDRAIFKKVYFKDLEKTKKKELIVQTMELDAHGKVYDYRKWTFAPQFINDDRKFNLPHIAFDDVNNELLIFGYMSVDQRNLNSLYLIKYDYSSQDLLYSKEYGFSEIFTGTDSKKTHGSIPKSVGAVVPLQFSNKDYYLNKKDRVFSVQIITNYNGSQTTYYEVKFDKYGDHVQTDLVQYGTYNFNYHNGLKSVPKFHETLMKDSSRPHFTNARPLARDYLNNNPNTTDNEIYALPIDRLDYSLIVFYNESSGEFSAIKLR